MTHLLKKNKLNFVLLMSFLVLSLFSCKQTKDLQLANKQELLKEWSHLGGLLNKREYKAALAYMDTMYVKSPKDPLLHFAEGWTYDMQHDTLRARAAYGQALRIYNSIVKKDTNMFNLVNRAFIIQALHGKNAYNKALDEILAIRHNHKDSLEVEQYWRKANYDTIKSQLHFAQ